jgi:hypothetical protein
VDAHRPCFGLQVEWAESVTALKSARVYVAPAFSHIIVNPDARLTVSAGSARSFAVELAVGGFDTGS